MKVAKYYKGTESNKIEGQIGKEGITMSVLIKRTQTPAYLVLAEKLHQAIISGTYPPGTKLAAYREMARLYGVSKNTVTMAVAELERLGLVQSQEKRGVYVRDRSTASVAPDWLHLMGAGGIVMSPIASHHRQKSLHLTEDAVNLSHRMVPGWDNYAGMSMVAPSIEKAVKDFQSGMFTGLYDEQGLLPLRQAIVEYLEEQYGIRTDPACVLILSRRMQCYNLMSELFLSPGITAAYQDVCFLNLYQAGISRSASRVLLPSDEQGLNITPLKKVKGKCFLFTQPTLCEPKGIMTDDGRREEIMDYCRGTKIPILEDAVMDPFYDGVAPVPLKVRDTGGNVIYLGGVHGPVTPGTSLNWVVAPKVVINGLLSLVRREAQFPSEMNQLIVFELLRQKQFLPFLQQEARRLKAHYAVAYAVLEKYLGDIATWRKQNSWGRIWVDFQEGISVKKIYRARRDVDFFPGAMYGDKSDRSVLLYVFCDPAQFEEGIQRLRILIDSQS